MRATDPATTAEGIEGPEGAGVEEDDGDEDIVDDAAGAGGICGAGTVLEPELDEGGGPSFRESMTLTRREIRSWEGCATVHAFSLSSVSRGQTHSAVPPSGEVESISKSDSTDDAVAEMDAMNGISGRNPTGKGQ